MIGIIGAGNMGRAIAGRVSQKILITDIDPSKLHFKKDRRILITRDNISLVERSDVIILAIKPQDSPSLLKEIAPYVKNKLIISILAGINTSFIEEVLKRSRVIRVMPNMAIMVGRGISAITAGRFACKKDLAIVRKIFLNLGEVVEVKENLFDAVTAVSGSGPAYYFLFTEMLQKAGISCGLKKDLAKRLAIAVFIGAAESAIANNISMQDFVKKVASKGGTTEAALKIFKERGLEEIVKKAVKSAREKSRLLSVNPESISSLSPLKT